MSTMMAVGILIYVAAAVLVWFLSGRTGLLFVLALLPLGLAYELIGRFFGEGWRLVLLIPLGLYCYYMQNRMRHRNEKRTKN
jgi:hypothetical protein